MSALPEDVPDELLDTLEIGRAEAACLLVLDEGAATSEDLQRATGFAQPRVSRAMRSLEDRGWVAAGIQKGSGAGRPPHVYRLRRPLDDLLEEAVREEASRLESMLQRLERAIRSERRRDP